MNLFAEKLSVELKNLGLNEDDIERIYVRDGAVEFNVKELKQLNDFKFVNDIQIGCTVYTDDWIIFLTGSVRFGGLKWWFESLPRNPEIYDITELTLYPIGC